MKVKNLKEAYESHNLDQPSFVDGELERLYGPVRNLIQDGKYEEAEAEIAELEVDLNEFEAQNKKKRFFRFPQFIIDGQRKQLAALRAKLPTKVTTVESFDTNLESRLQLEESVFEDIKLTLDESSKETSYELAARIATLAKKEMKLSAYEAEMLEHDINNLRGYEWIDQFSRLPETSVAKHLFFAHVIEYDNEAVKEIIHGIVEEMFEVGHPDPEAWADVMDELEGYDFDEKDAHEYFISCLNHGPEGILSEALLVEGPLGPALRKFGRAIADKFGPKNAEKRQIKGHEKDDKAQHEKHAHPILARDFTTKAQKWRFIANKKDAQPVNFDQWWDMYKDVATDPNDSSYAEWYNACVIGPDGYYIRRGSEDMNKQQIKYNPGVNDEVLRMYRVEPYTWFKKDDNIEPPPDFDDGGDDDTDPEKKKKGGKKKKKGGKDKKPVGAPELDRFRKLCLLTSFRVYRKDTKNELTYPEICDITVETIPAYFVNTQYGRKSSLDVWFQAAIKSKFLYKLPEYIERFYKPTLNEAALTESPKIQLDAVDLMNPASVNFHDLIKRAMDKEKAELASKAQEEARVKYRAKYKTVASLASQYRDTPDEAVDVLFNILVPAEGKADTVAGELIRATMRLLYRSYNDGDVFYKGYGLETCAPSAMYLYNNGFDELIDSVIEKAADHDFSDDEYDAMLKELTKQVIDYIIENPDCIYTENTTDSRDCDPEYIVDQQPTYDFEFYGSEDIVELVDAQLLNSWALKEYVEQQLNYNTVTQSYETERPYTHYDHQVTVSGLTADAVDFIENDLFRDVDSFWSDLVDEYADELEQLRNEYDDDYDDEAEDIDESVDSPDIDDSTDNI